MIGAVVNDSISIVGHGLFNNFIMGLENYLKQNIKRVDRIDNLKDIETLFIIDEHFAPNVSIWKDDSFIKEINNNNTRVVVFNFEKIFNSKFPWNVSHQNKLQEIKNLFQLVSDVSDAEKLNKTIINKQLLSRDTKLVYDKTDKKDRVLFIGQCDKLYNPSYAYSRRYQLLQQLKNIPNIPLDIITTGRKLSYKEYMTTLASYKYILNPLGTGDFLNLRFYEALEVGCIPIQQVTESMRNKYKELNYSHIFLDASDFKIPEISFKKMNYYLEDYFEEISLQDLL